MKSENIKPENTCPVCGYEMEAPPTDYRICPSCGTEFGLHDRNATIEELRHAWIASGPRWWSKTDPMPANWDPLAQVEKVRIVAQPKLAGRVFVLSSSTAVAAGSVSGVTIVSRNTTKTPFNPASPLNADKDAAEIKLD